MTAALSWVSYKSVATAYSFSHYLFLIVATVATFQISVSTPLHHPPILPTMSFAISLPPVVFASTADMEGNGTGLAREKRGIYHASSDI
jgi:hypothetical protein